MDSRKVKIELSDDASVIMKVIRSNVKVVIFSLKLLTNICRILVLLGCGGVPAVLISKLNFFVNLYHYFS